MTVGDILDITREALWIIIKCSAPMLIVSLVVGLVISIFQTATSIQEQTLTFGSIFNNYDMRLLVIRKF